MSTSWTKSLHCKSNAFNDVANAAVCSPTATKKAIPKIPSCANSHTIKDVATLLQKYPSPSTLIPKRPKSRPKSKPKSQTLTLNLAASPAPVNRSCPFPELAELPSGHSSRRVVEIIFNSSWSGGEFTGVVEMMFRVHNSARTIARFEEYRAAVRCRSDDPRCAADGNEMMRFHAGAGGEGIYEASVTWRPEGIRTFAGSAGAHESAGAAAGGGRRSLLVCRVIAGRVLSESLTELPGESLSRGKGEIVVFDSRAVLPCFLIIYKP